MKRIAMVKNGIVENVSIWDIETAWNPSSFELFDITDVEVGIGDIYTNGAFSKKKIINDVYVEELILGDVEQVEPIVPQE